MDPNTLEIQNLSAGGNYSSYRKGNWFDYCHNFSFKFTNKVYGIIGPFGGGGFALANTLVGNDKNFEGKILFNDRIVNSLALKELSCYVFNLPNNYKKNKTVGSYLKEAINKNKDLNLTLDHYLEKFNSSGLNVRLDFRLSRLSSELYDATMAIGFAQGKKIFCFPFMEYNELLIYINRFKNLTNFLKENGCIIIIPTDKRDYLNFLFDEFVEIKCPQTQFIEEIRIINEQLKSKEKSIQELAEIRGTTVEGIQYQIEHGEKLGYLK